jgi:hypothetical protein
MKERPILLSPVMVAALLARLKLQTRRIIKESFNGCYTDGGPHPCPNEPLIFKPGEVYDHPFNEGEKMPIDGDRVQAHFFCSTLNSVAFCPYGQVGDLLWVRETHYRYGHWEKNGLTKRGKQKWKFVAVDDEVLYQNEPPKNFKISRDTKNPDIPAWYKRLARFMPKSADRIWLKVSDIGVESLQYITELDAIDEGVLSLSDDFIKLHFAEYHAKLEEWKEQKEVSRPPIGPTPKERFEKLWDSIEGPGAYELNPWVWVVKFDIVSTNGKAGI